MMFYPRVAVLLYLSMVLYLVSSGCKGQGSNCTIGECPKYTVVHSGNDFEIRNYEESVWMSGPRIFGDSYMSAFSSVSDSLEDYYLGKNSKHVKISVTPYIAVDVDGWFYTVYYYLPQKYQNDIPAPLSDKVKAVKLPKHKYTAVRRATHGLSDELIAVEIDALKKSLQGTPYERAAASTLFTVASNVAPAYYNIGHNEIWLSFD